jgi:hypothetical protein
LVYALAVQAALLALTVFVIVVVPSDRAEPEFSAGRTVYLPQKELEHRVALSEFQNAAAQPLLLEKLVTAALLPPDLPALPTVARVDEDRLDAADALAQDAQALLAQSGLAGAVGGLRSARSTAAFFGIEDSGERVAILVNTSVSVRNKAQRRGVEWSHLQSEVVRLVDGLQAGTQFCIVQFSQGVRTFPEHMAPATASNRAATRAWIERSLKGNPPVEPGQTWYGHEAAFESAMRLQPDLVFLVTDGVLDRREERGGRTVYPLVPYEEFAASLRAFAKQSGRSFRVHVVGFEMDGATAAAMRRLASDYGGQVRSF